MAQKQKCVSHSTTEAETVAADTAVRTEGLPALEMWDMVLERKNVLKIMEDNEAMMK